MSLTIILFAYIVYNDSVVVVNQPMYSMEQCEAALQRLSKTLRFRDGFCISDYANTEPKITE